VTYSPQLLQEFEDEIKDCYLNAMIRAPIHLRSGCEAALIDIFQNVKPEDYVYSYWASHLHCLLKGVPREQLKQQILDGNSISLCFPEYNVYCSGIVGSLAGVAVGTALALKRNGKPGHVWLFTGDMGAECGIFHEAVKYATNFDLPITFVVEDNGVSVLTDTRATWGDAVPWWEGTRYAEKIRYFRYVNGYPHSGISVKVAF
jgi:TPP-dependent pyruvate/acetoin dehydrogenase alpha subunit